MTKYVSLSVACAPTQMAEQKEVLDLKDQNMFCRVFIGLNLTRALKRKLSIQT